MVNKPFVYWLCSLLESINFMNMIGIFLIDKGLEEKPEIRLASSISKRQFAPITKHVCFVLSWNLSHVCNSLISKAVGIFNCSPPYPYPPHFGQYPNTRSSDNTYPCVAPVLLITYMWQMFSYRFFLLFSSSFWTTSLSSIEM